MLVEIDIDPQLVDKALVNLSVKDKQQYLNELGDMFTDILSSSRAGHHRIFLKRKLCQWVFSNLDLRLRDKNQVLLIEERAWQTGNIIKSVPCKLTVELNKKASFRKMGLHWRVSHKNFSSGFALHRTQLLVENALNDGDIFSKIFEIESARLGVGFIDFKPVHGGGSTMHELFKRQVKDKEFVLCIGDRDCLVPSDDSKNKLMKLYNTLKSDDFVGFATLTPGYSIENFFPLAIIESLATKIVPSEVAELYQLIRSQKNVKRNDCLWLYFNVKSGIEIGSLDKFKDKRNWIASKFQVSLNKIKNIKFQGFGEINAHFLKSVEQQENFEKFVNSDYWKLHFSPWLEPILWFLCGDEPSNIGK